MSADRNTETLHYSAGPMVGANGRVVPLLGMGDTVDGDRYDDRYQITNRISLGNLREIYGATDWQAEGPGAVAIKAFYEPNLDISQRVGREIAAHVALNGEAGIVPLHSTGVLDKDGRKHRYIATALSEGGTLSDRIDQHHNDLDMMRSMALQILPALETMHARGMVHRDVKPDNILVDAEGSEFALTDFGIVGVGQIRGLGRTSLDGIGRPASSPGEPLRVDGTIGFIAPETFTDEGDIGPEVDVFAMGVVLFHGMTGILPFGEGEIHEYEIAVTRESPVSLRSLNRMVPAVLEELTMESLRKDPRDRPRIDELEARLQAA